MRVDCPNCGTAHEPVNGNNYCTRCAARFRKFGLKDHINDEGEIGCTPGHEAWDHPPHQQGGEVK